MCDLWEKPQDAWSLHELEQLRILSMYEFDPPLSAQELLNALRTCGNRTEDAYQYLKINHRDLHSTANSVSTSTATISDIIRKHNREKRCYSVTSVDSNGTPNKRYKGHSFALTALEEDSREDEKQGDTDDTPMTQTDEESLPTSSNDSKAQQLLLEMVEDRIAGRQPPRNPEWVNDLWKWLQVKPILEVATRLNLTADALVIWVKEVKLEDAQDIQTQGVALVVEVVASQPREVTNVDETITCLVEDKKLSASDEEVAAIVQAENNCVNLTAIARANAAKLAIDCLSSACKAYMDLLSQFSLLNEEKCKERAQTETALESLSQKCIRLVDESSSHVMNAERALSDAKDAKETQSLQIAQCVREKHDELVNAGETDASASIQSVIEVWKQNDTDVQALWSSWSGSDQFVEKSARELKVAQHALTFYKNLSVLFGEVRERHEKVLSKTFEDLNEACASFEARATTALGTMIPMLTRALFTYFEFHSVQQSKAKKELEKQEKALTAHNEYFGDSAPIKKDDIERRIREFMGVTQSSMQVVTEIAEGQQQLWKNKHAVLSESIRHVLICEFKALYLQLSGPMQDVVKKFMTTIEESTGGAVVAEPKHAQPCQLPPSPMFNTTIALDDQVCPAFTIPAFPISHGEAITPYRMATSAISALGKVSSASGSPLANKEHDSTSVPMTISSPNTALPESNETIEASSLPQKTLIKSRKPRHEFAVGSVLYSKVTADKTWTQFVRGVVVKHLANDMYLMQYNNGDKFSVGRPFLFTKDLMEDHLKVGDTQVFRQDTEMESVEHKSSAGNCVIM